MNFDVKDEILYLHDETTPVHSSFTITIEDNKYTDRKKVFIADISKSGRVGYNTTYRKDVFTAKVRSLGKYALAIDTTAQQFLWVNPLKEDGLVHKKQFNSPLMIPAQELRAMTGI
jgi:uncharacterized protein with von Willebrand factor type A (vWA) domain